MIVDFHNHYYPPGYIAALQAEPSSVRVTFDSEKNPVLHSPADINIVVRGHRDIAYRQEVLEREGIDRQVLTFTSPGVHVEEVVKAQVLARSINTELARIQSERGDHFLALATLPLASPAAAVAELDRATGELGLRGAMMFSNINGVALSDERFWPLYELASDREMVLFIHPTHPVGVEAMTDYWLMPLVGFLFDTTLAAAGLVFSGAVERFDGIRWVLGHLGGAIPYLAERLDRGYEAFSECRANLTRPPSEHLKRFYYDTVNFDPAALRLALDFAGASQILAGSDYPHRIGSLRKMVDSLHSLELSDCDREAILGGNALRLLAPRG